MALRAGYYGIKKNVLNKLLNMAGSLVIKSLGTALSLSDAGELRVRNASASQSGVVRPDGETIVIENGLLKVAEGASVTYELLWSNEGTTNPSTITLPDISDYDIVVLNAFSTYQGNKYLRESTLISHDLSGFLPFNIQMVAGGDSLVYSLTALDTLTYVSAGGNHPIVRDIVGIKF